MAQGTLGDLVTFAISGVTVAGVVIGNPSTTTTTVAYDLGIPHADTAKWAKEASTTSVTTVSGSLHQ